MQEIIQQLKEAISCIEDKYFQRNERDFAYELYHKIREKELKNSVEITAETPKSGHRIPKKLLQDDFFVSYFFNKNNIDFENGKFFRTPDLLLHEYSNRNQQLIAIEIKKSTESIAKLKADLTKLVYYSRGSLKYNKCILLLYGDFRVAILNNIEIREFLIQYPEIEIWIARPQTEIEIICATNLA